MRALILVAACAAPPAPEPGRLPPDAGPVAFAADGVVVPTAALDALVRRIPRQQAASLHEDARTTEFVEHVALTQALYRRALDAEVHRDVDVRYALAMAEREVLASEYLRAAARRVVTPEYVAARYDEMPEFRIEQLRTWHLRLADDADPDALRSAIARSTFGEVARAESTDVSTTATGGDLGWLDRAVVEGAFGPEAAAAPAGALVGPVAAAGGRHLVWIESRRDAVPLAEVEAGLTAELESREMARLTEQVRSELVVERP